MKLPQFVKDEKVNVDQNDISDYDDEDEPVNAKDQAKTERFQQIKDKLKKGKYKDAEVRGGRLLRIMFKTVTSLM